MITLQMLKGTGPYNQMQRYIADVHKHLTPQQRAGKFTALLKKYVQNSNKQRPYLHVVKPDIRSSFTWHKAKEGYEFWGDIDRFACRPIVKQPKEQPPIKVAVQPDVLDVPAVWPKGFTIAVIISKRVRFIREEGQKAAHGIARWGDPDNFHKFQRIYPTIKRPESPLPNGEQWGEEYTHWTPGPRGRPFQFNDEGLFHPGLGRFEKWVPGFHAKALKNCIARYPDNQPFILDNAPQAPVRPVREERAEAVGQPVQAENVAARPLVEPPKALPVAKKEEQPVKKQVGWWK